MVIIIGAAFVIVGILMLAPAPFLTFLPQRFVIVILGIVCCPLN